MNGCGTGNGEAYLKYSTKLITIYDKFKAIYCWPCNKQTAKYVDKICEPIVTPKYSYDPIEPKISQAMKDWGVYKW